MNSRTVNLLRAAAKAAIAYGIDYYRSQQTDSQMPAGANRWQVRLTTAATPPSMKRFSQIAYHPQFEQLGICVRAEWDGLFLIWRGGYRKHKIQDISTSEWQIPIDHKGRVLPLKIKRCWFAANVMGSFAVDVRFRSVKLPPQC